MEWLYFLLLLVPVVHGCPSDVMEGVKQCMDPMEPYTVSEEGGGPRHRYPGKQGSVFMIMSSLDKTSQLCADGKIQNAFACLNKLYNLCASTKEGAHHFDLLVDVGKWRQAMDQICDNIHYLQNNEECERQARADFEPCVARKVQYFQTQMIAMEGEMTHVPHSQRIEATMRLGCSFTQDITDCLRDPYSKYCPEHMTNLLLDVVQNFMPPACVGMGYEDKSYPYPQGDYDPDDDDEDYGDNRHDFTHTDIVIGSGKESPSGDADDDDDVRNSYEDRESNVKQPNPGYRVNKPSSGNEGVIGAARSEGKGDDDDENGQGRVVMDVPTFFVFITLCVLSISSLSWMC